MERRIKFNGEIFRNGNELADYLKDTMFTINAAKFVKTFMKEVKTFYNFLDNNNKNLMIP